MEMPENRRPAPISGRSAPGLPRRPLGEGLAFKPFVCVQQNEVPECEIQKVPGTETLESVSVPEQRDTELGFWSVP